MGRWANSLLPLIRCNLGMHTIATVRTNRPLPWLYRCAIRNADQLVANSQWALDYATRTARRSSKRPRHVIHNGLSRPDLLKIRPGDKQQARRTLKMPENARIMLSVARLDQGKNQSDLIHMLTLDPTHRSHLFLMGTGPEESRLRKLSQHLKLDERVHFKGFLENLNLYYTAADLAVSASLLDSLPNALIEAQAAGLPVVAYPTAGIPEIVVDGHTGFLSKSNNYSELYKLSSRIFENPDFANRLGTNAREHISLDFKPGIQIQKYRMLLDGLTRKNEATTG